MMLHHAAVPTRDLERARSFYRDVFGLKEIGRPPFKTQGAWFAIGNSHLHVVLMPEQGTFRKSPSINTGDTHFAVSVEDFEVEVKRLAELGYRKDRPDGDPLRLFAIRGGPAGFPQAYLLDPDWNIVEINTAHK